MHWVTKRGIKINRAATAWLIRRFIDPDAELVFVASASEVAAEATRLGGTGFHRLPRATRAAARRSRRWLRTAAATTQHFAR